MRRIWQVAVIIGFALGTAQAQEKAFPWEPLKVRSSVFPATLGMLDTERGEYAENLAVSAANRLAEAKASPAALASARRVLGLALQLSPRNKKAVVLNFQLEKGILPERMEANYTLPVFARLLFSRGQLLEKQEGLENLRLARMFVELAAEMDPKNPDIVYAREIHRLDHGEIDWSAITDPTPAP